MVGINDDIGNVIRKSNLLKRSYSFLYTTRFLNMKKGKNINSNARRMNVHI